MALRVPYEGFCYHPHQESGIRWMMAREAEDALFVRGGILADEMGLGKTWETLGLLLNAPVPHTLLLVPPVLLVQWSKVLEMAQIYYSVLMPGGKWRHTGTQGIHVYLSTYDRIVRNMDVLADQRLDRIVADEGHALRNSKTRRFLTLQRLEAPRRWILSGTPVQNRQEDFRSLCVWLGLRRNLEITWAEYAAELILRRVVADVKETVPEFPENKPTHHIVPVTMPEGDEKTVFDALVQRFENALDLHATSIQILELYLRIRQFLAHPQIYIDAMHRKFQDYRRARVWTGTASKMEAFQRLLHETPKRPTIVFTNFQEEMEHAENILEAEGFRTFKVCGGQTDKARAAILRESEESAATVPTAILIQIVAGNAGLNLQHMNRIIFLSSHWNPAVVDQAVARAYRIGQTKQVDVYHILLADGAEKNLDRYIAKCHARKRDVARKLHEKLVCDAAVNSEHVLEELNLICPEEGETE
jgi:SNF2 family DNA or RNA helicase